MLPNAKVWELTPCHPKEAVNLPSVLNATEATELFSSHFVNL